MQSNIKKTEGLLKLLGLTCAEQSSEQMGYSQSPMNALCNDPKRNLSPKIQAALNDITGAVEALAETEPKAGAVIIARFIVGDSLARIGEELGEPGTPVSRRIVSELSTVGVAWITGYLERG